MSIEIISAYDHKNEVGKLFKEYTDMLIAGDAKFKEYLAVQHYDDELLHLESKYGLPHGRLYLAYCDDEVAGCIGLRKLDDTRCEMKRLYVRDKFCGRKIGQALVQRIIRDAKDIGYKQILLDTLPFLKSALHMYKQFGFREISCYNDSPMETSIYMQLDL